MLGMSQADLGTALGISFQQEQKYENGVNRLRAGRLQQLSHILRCFSIAAIRSSA
jgi:transcriptional regulator with XRE-family HTH domain